MLIPIHLLWHESNGVVAGDGALVQVRSCETLVILITSFGEFPFIILLSVFVSSIHCKKKKKKVVAGLFLCCLVLTAGVHFGLNCGLMEYLEGEQHYQYPVERNPRTYMSMRDYRNPPWVSAPSYMVPPQYAPPPHPQSTSPMEEAILNLTKLMGNFVEVQKTINAQLSQKIDTMENIMDMRIDGLQSEMEHKLDNLQYSISVLTNHQHVHQEKVNPE